VVVAAAVRDYRLQSILSLARQVLALGVEFGAHSLEALVWVARTVEESVYVAGSLARTPTGFRFALANPPLRTGAFSSVRVLVDGRPIPSDHVRLRPGPLAPWRTVSSIGPDRPLELRAGTPTEFEADWRLGPKPTPLTIRLELQSVAIPPLVWLEFRQVPKEGRPG
jgi:hypothetical protein